MGELSTVGCVSTLFSSTCPLQVSQVGPFPGMCRFVLVRNSTIPRVSCTLSTVVVSDNCGEESAHGAGETDMCVWDDSTFPKINNPVTRSWECGLASVPQAGTGHESDGLAFQGESPATCTEDYEAKSRVIASTTQTCHLDGYGYGLAVHHLRQDDRVAVFYQHPR